MGHHHSPGLSDLVRDDSVVVFETRDHSPDDEKEIQRLKRGREQGYDYSIPQCSMSQSWMQIGDYQYALCRSLEGSYVTSKGIVSDPDGEFLRNVFQCEIVCNSDASVWVQNS